jgi:hypothetical protein
MSSTLSFYGESYQLVFLLWASLGMAIPDMWIKLLKEVSDEKWDIGMIIHTLTNRRHEEGTIGFEWMIFLRRMLKNKRFK